MPITIRRCSKFRTCSLNYFSNSKSPSCFLPCSLPSWPPFTWLWHTRQPSAVFTGCHYTGTVTVRRGACSAAAAGEVTHELSPHPIWIPSSLVRALPSPQGFNKVSHLQGLLSYKTGYLLGLLLPLAVATRKPSESPQSVT